MRSSSYVTSKSKPAFKKKKATSPPLLKGFYRGWRKVDLNFFLSGRTELIKAPLPSFPFFQVLSAAAPFVILPTHRRRCSPLFPVCLYEASRIAVGHS